MDVGMLASSNWIKHELYIYEVNPTIKYASDQHIQHTLSVEYDDGKTCFNFLSKISTWVKEQIIAELRPVGQVTFYDR